MPCERAEQPLSHIALEAFGHTRPDGDHDGWAAEGYLFTCLQPVEPGDTWQPQSCPEPGRGARSMGTRGCPGAASSWELEPEPRGHVVASELLSAGRQKPLS
jgi:hypothetical protein